MFFKRVHRNESADEVKNFIAAGGRPTWQDWKEWTDDQKKVADETHKAILNYYFLQLKYQLAFTWEEKRSIADEMKEYDGGVMSRAVREIINQIALRSQVNERSSTS